MKIEIWELVDVMVKQSKYSPEQIASQLAITSRTLRRYQNAERMIPADKFWQLVVITDYAQALIVLEKELNHYWHRKRKATKSM